MDGRVPRAEFPVSVIVCFYNEEAQLAACLEGILGQTYLAALEVILVDDNSTDRSPEIALRYAGYDDRIRVVHPGVTRPGKKDALTYGIEQARYECMVLTDADCIPASKLWLAHMAAGLRGSGELALGVSPYRARVFSPLLARWQQFESFYVSLKYLGFAAVGLPYMGVGRNMAYTQGFFARAGGLGSHADLPSGDDDLLVSGSASARATRAVTHPKAWTWSHPHGTWSSYFRQRARHQSTGVRYPPGAAALLTLLALTQVGFYVCSAWLLWQVPAVVISLYFIRVVFVLRAFQRPYGYLGADVTTPQHCGAGVGKGRRSTTWWATVLIGDIALVPMYLYLAVAGLRPRGDWG